MVGLCGLCSNNKLTLDIVKNYSMSRLDSCNFTRNGNVKIKNGITLIASCYVEKKWEIIMFLDSCNACYHYCDCCSRKEHFLVEVAKCKPPRKYEDLTYSICKKIISAIFHNDEDICMHYVLLHSIQTGNDKLIQSIVVNSSIIKETKIIQKNKIVSNKSYIQLIFESKNYHLLPFFIQTLDSMSLTNQLFDVHGSIMNSEMIQCIISSFRKNNAEFTIHSNIFRCLIFYSKIYECAMREMLSCEECFLNSTDIHGNTLLLLACANNNMMLAKMLIVEFSVDTNVVNDHNYSIFNICPTVNQDEMLNKFIKLSKSLKSNRLVKI